MAFNGESLIIREYINETSRELIPVIEAVQKANNHEIDGKKFIEIGLFQVAFALANLDGNISLSEITFIQETLDLFRGSDLNVIAEHSRKKIFETQHLYTLELPACFIYLNPYDKAYGTNYGDKARAMFFRFANSFVKADGKISLEEQSALNRFRQTLYPDSPSANLPDAGEQVAANINNVNCPNPASFDEAMKELNKLIGLETVKSDVTQLLNFLKVQQIRLSKGLPAVPISRHLVFFGNPGTGKTTVARLLAQIYKELGIISKGHLVETDRSGLVGGFVGQTAIKVKEVVTKALGGVLFIDEAYTLIGEGQDYGREAIDTLLKLMEDNRGDLIVVVAGYTEKMGKFLALNPGMKSRFNKYLYFEDYQPGELVDIFESFCKKSSYNLTDVAKDKVLGIFKISYELRDNTFGNARLARNLFEQTMNNQANRIVTLTDIVEATLSTIEEVDIPVGVHVHS